MEVWQSLRGSTNKENPFSERIDSKVSDVDVQAARAQAQSLSSSRRNVENPVENVHIWQAHSHTPTPMPNRNEESLEHIHALPNQEQAYHINQEDRSTLLSTGMQPRNHFRKLITPRSAYKRSLNTANFELMSFREKFDEWKMTYEREIGKTKACLASMAPTLKGLSLAARIHKIAGKAAMSLNSTPSKTTSPTSSVATTPRTHCENVISCLQPLHLDTERVSNVDDFSDFFYNDAPILSERAEKLAEVSEDVDVLTTIIEKKIFATHIPNYFHADNEEKNVIELSSWSDNEEELTAQTEKTMEHIVLKPDVIEEESNAIVSKAMTLPTKENTPLKKLNMATGPESRPVNLRDNLIILAKQKGYTDVGTPLCNEDTSTNADQREKAMLLLRKMYAPLPTSASMHMSTPSEDFETNADNKFLQDCKQERTDENSSMLIYTEQKVDSDVKISNFRQLFQNLEGTSRNNPSTSTIPSLCDQNTDSSDIIPSEKHCEDQVAMPDLTNPTSHSRECKQKDFNGDNIDLLKLPPIVVSDNHSITRASAKNGEHITNGYSVGLPLDVYDSLDCGVCI